MGWVHAPWAVAANGIRVPTAYSVSGNILTQTVDTVGVTSWPVVADPTISFGWVIYVHFSHQEVGEVVWTAFFAGAGAALGAACAAISLTLLTAGCVFLAAAATTVMIGIFQTAFNRGGGLVLEFLYNGDPYGYEYVGNNWT